MTKAQLTLKVIANNRLSNTYSHLILQANKDENEIMGLFNSIQPGQFVEVRVDGSKNTFLRRPISVNYIVTKRNPLLIGGGVGVAPLLFLGEKLREKGVTPTFLLAARTANDILMYDRFREIGNVLLSTDDGSVGHHGLVTENPALISGEWDMFYCCGPMPMMRGIAQIASRLGTECEVSLENSMACGLGACLCCVEDTVDGNVCVCKDGPVFNISRLKW